MRCINSVDCGSRLMCKVEGENSLQPCPYQKYCHQENKWENSPSYTNCERIQLHMDEKFENSVNLAEKNFDKKNSKKKNSYNVVRDLDTNNEIVEVVDNVVETLPKVDTAPKTKGKVIKITKYSALIKIDDDNLVLKKEFKNCKVGDIVEF